MWRRAVKGYFQKQSFGAKVLLPLGLLAIAKTHLMFRRYGLYQFKSSFACQYYFTFKVLCAYILSNLSAYLDILVVKLLYSLLYSIIYCLLNAHKQLFRYEYFKSRYTKL